jgi:hypothetical protein
MRRVKDIDGRFKSRDEDEDVKQTLKNIARSWDNGVCESESEYGTLNKGKRKPNLLGAKAVKASHPRYMSGD